jgi:hypothetical protein
MAAKKCITKDCHGTAKRRGLCDSCYYSARKMIASGEVPGWEWMEKKGLANPRGGTPMTREIRRRLRSHKSRTK